MIYPHQRNNYHIQRPKYGVNFERGLDGSMQKCHKKTEAFKNFHGALCQNKLILIQESKIFYPLILFNPGADFPITLGLGQRNLSLAMW